MLTISLLEERLYEQSIHGPRPSSRKIAAKANHDLLLALTAETSTLPPNATVLERLYAFKHQIAFRPSCLTCNGPLHDWSLKRFDVKNGYTKFCSAACSKRHPDTNAKLVATSLAKYGVDSPLKAASVKQKIESSNLNRFGFKTSLQASHVKEARLLALNKYHADERKLRFAALKRIGQRAYADFCVEVDEGLFLDKLMMRFTHSCGHTFEVRLINGQPPRCPKCDPQKSNITQPHKVIRELITAEFIENSRSLLKPSRKELDLYIPSVKLGIEINGLYWHSFFSEERSLVQLTKTYHLEKTKLAEANGIKLLHIWEHEVNDSRMHDLILSRLGKTQKIGARTLAVRTIPHDVARQFISANHIQGSVNSSYQAGLFNDDELLAVMTFGKPRFNKTVEWELLRFCSKAKTTVVGGASRLLAKFIKDVNPSSILSYSDRRLGGGTVYAMLGFKLAAQTAPGYFYWKTDKAKLELVSRYMAQKHKLGKLLGEKFDASLTEQQNMLNAGYGMIYDCGQNVFVKHIKTK